MRTDIEMLAFLANTLGHTQAIYFGHDGKKTYCVTWGQDAKLSAQAAAGGNAIKKKWGWPDDTIVESAKVTELQRKLDEALAKIRDLESVVPTVNPTVHVIEGTEYERGWGCRPDGYVAFTSKASAEVWIAEYNERNHTSDHAPDEYTNYTYIGIKDCSHGFLKVTKQVGAKHFDRLSEMLE